MSIPAFTIDGVLPPYIGASGPGGQTDQMTPYEARPIDVVKTFRTTSHRQKILEGWLAHRERLAAAGITAGFQWLDGSFVENKVPSDIDVVTFLRRPSRIKGPEGVRRWMNANPEAFKRSIVKENLLVDAFFVDMDGTKPALVNLTRYYLGLFSHRRGDDLWKGMIKVPLDPNEDATATEWLEKNPLAEQPADAQ